MLVEIHLTVHQQYQLICSSVENRRTSLSMFQHFVMMNLFCEYSSLRPDISLLTLWTKLVFLLT